MSENHIILTKNEEYLVKKLLNLFKLLRSEISGVYALNFLSELRKELWVRARRERE